jgi:hypothetical protein
MAWWETGGTVADQIAGMELDPAEDFAGVGWGAAEVGQHDFARRDDAWWEAMPVEFGVDEGAGPGQEPLGMPATDGCEEVFHLDRCRESDTFG